MCVLLASTVPTRWASAPATSPPSKPITTSQESVSLLKRLVPLVLAFAPPFLGGGPIHPVGNLLVLGQGLSPSPQRTPGPSLRRGRWASPVPTSGLRRGGSGAFVEGGQSPEGQGPFLGERVVDG